MKKFFTNLSILGLFVFCFVVSILTVLWWKSSSFQVYIPPKKLSSTATNSRDLFNIKLNGKYGCIDKEGKIAIEPKFDDIQCSEDELIPIEINEKWGFVNQSGEIILEPQFYLSPTGYSKYFCMNRKCGYIDSSGNYVIEPKFDYAENFSDGLAIVQIGAYDFLGYRLRFPKTVFINKQGEILFDKENFTIEHKFTDGLAKVSVNGKFGFIDKSGKFVINPQDKNIGSFQEGLATISDKSGVLQLGYVNKNGQVVIPQQFKQAGEFSEGLANVMFENGKYGYIDKTGKTVIEPQFDYAGTFYDERAVVSIGTKNGYVDKIGKVVVPIQFGSAERFVNGLAQVSFDDQNPPYENKKRGYIDKSGNFILKPTN